MQAVNLGAALCLALLPHPPRQYQRPGEHLLKSRVAGSSPADVPHDASKIGPQPLQRPGSAPELLGVALVLDQGELADPLRTAAA